MDDEALEALIASRPNGELLPWHTPGCRFSETCDLYCEDRPVSNFAEGLSEADHLLFLKYVLEHLGGDWALFKQTVDASYYSATSDELRDVLDKFYRHP